ncbi:MAG: MFS transporter [Candidatus Thorarchaeota archaeon]
MIIKPLMILLGVHQLPNRAQGLVQKFVVVLIFADFLFYLSSTFYVLFVIDSVGFAQLGLLLAVRFLLQALLDYPSGALGDWIGQKWVLFIAYLAYALAYALLIWADSFSALLVVYLLYGFAASQQSGAWDAWFDNNYRVAAQEPDPQRETYKLFFGRRRMVMNFIGAVAFIVGGIAATIHFRESIFAIQAIGMFVVAIVILFVIKDFAEVERPKKTLQEYFKLLGEGFYLVVSNRALLFLMIGICCYGVVWAVWGEMILFPLYFGYTGTDAGASILRFIIWIITIPIVFFAAKLAAQLGIKWYPRINLIFSILFFGSIMLLTAWIPPEDTFEPIGFILTAIFIGSIMLFFYITELLDRRIFLDLIPDRNRSSVYSLRPTLVLLARVPGVIIGGLFLTDLGLPITIGILGTLGIIATIFFYIAIRFLPNDILEHPNSFVEEK